MMPDLITGSSGESSMINDQNQVQFVSADPNLKPKFNLTSFYTTTSACPVDFYQVSDDFYDPASASNQVANDYYSFPAGITPFNFIDSDEIYPSLSSPIDIDEDPSPTISGTVSSKSFQIEVLDGKKPFLYSFKIKVWMLGGQSTHVSPILSLHAKCPTFLGNNDELVPNTQFNFLTWVGAPASESVYTMTKQYETLLP